MPPGYVTKCMARYETPVLARRRPLRPGGEPERPLAITFDNSPADGSCGVMLGFLEGGHGRRAAALSPEAAPRPRPRRPRGLLRPAGARRRSSTSSRTGPPRSGSAAATAPTWLPAPGPTTATCSASPRAWSTGPARRRAPSGTATWTARSARASGSRRRSPRALAVASRRRPRATRRPGARARKKSSRVIRAWTSPLVAIGAISTRWWRKISASWVSEYSSSTTTWSVVR